MHARAGLFKAAPDRRAAWRRGLVNRPPAVMHPFVPQCASDVQLHRVWDCFVAPGAATDAANPVQRVIAAEAGVASEDGHEWR